MLTLAGKKLLAVRHETAKAERVTLHPTLTRAGAASVRKSHKRGLKVPVKVTFKPVSGASSSATRAADLPLTPPPPSTPNKGAGPTAAGPAPRVGAVRWISP